MILDGLGWVFGLSCISSILYCRIGRLLGFGATTARTSAQITYANGPRARVAMTSDAEYALGSTKAEHERLVRQAKRYEPITERLFREAGVRAGQRVLDLG